MRIAILTSGVLPVPAVQGGAAENLIDFYLEYNNLHRLHDITVYSVWHPDVRNHPTTKSDVNHYKYVIMDGWWARIKKNIFKKTHPMGFYHHTIDYFLHEIIKDIRKKQFEIILMENRPGYALSLKSITTAKLVYHLHNDKLDSQTPHCQELYDAAYRIITVSNYIKSRVQTINSLDTKTHTVYNGINLSAFKRKGKGKDLRPSFGLQDNDFVIVFSGRINRQKGIMELIEAFSLIKEEPHIKLMVIGSSFFGDVSDDEGFMQELKEKACHLKERIIFTGYIPYSDMPNYLSMADAAIIPSVWDDPFPTTVLEAQAMGLPIITTRRGGIPEEVTEKNAIILDTNEHFTQTLADAILNLYQHPEKCHKMSAASLERSSLFDKDTYAKNLFASLEQKANK